MSCLVIAEMANAHEGSPVAAKAIVEAAAEAGADAIKFQVFTAAELAVPDYAHFDVYERLQLSEEEWTSLVVHAKGLGLQVYADVFGLEGAALMLQLSVDGFMIHAADILNTPLLGQVGCAGIPTILSVAGSTLREVADALTVLESAGAPSVLLMHGFQGYPTPLSDSCLNRISVLRNEFSRRVGFASHVDGGSPQAVILPVLAASLGAEAIEVHLTLDRSEEGLDYYSSMDPPEFTEMVQLLRTMESALGPSSMELPDGELKYKRDHRKCLVATRDIEAGEVIREEDVAFKRTDSLPAEASQSLDSVLGRPAQKRIPKHSPIPEMELPSERRAGR